MMAGRTTVSGICSIPTCSQELGVHDDALRDALVDATRISANWRDIRPGTRETLLRLGRRYPLAVISNADGKIGDVLTRCGIADCFAAITDSGLVGYEKPHPAIFEAALRGMDVSRRAKFVRRRHVFRRLSGCDPGGNASRSCSMYLELIVNLACRGWNRWKN